MSLESLESPDSLLHLDAGANRAPESITRALSARYAAAWCARHGPAGYRYRDLAAEPVAPLGTAYCALGRRVERHGCAIPDVAALTTSGDETHEWALTRPLINELLAARTVLIGSPMYNFSVPAALKAWIDRVTFPGAFTDRGTGEPLLRDTRLVVICARGGTYGEGSPRARADFQIPYLRAYFARQGIRAENMHFVAAELALAELAPHLAHLRDKAAESLAAATAEVDALATAPA